jgi:hypothetical protein
MHSRTFAGAIALWLVAIAVPVDAKPIYIRDQCNETSGDGQGHTCANSDDLLVRPKFLNPDGSTTCGDWICCPKNADGQSYNCDAGTPAPRELTTNIDKAKLYQAFPQVKAVFPTQPVPPKRVAPGVDTKNMPVFRGGAEGEEEVPQ